MFRPVAMVHMQVQIPDRDGAAVTRRIAAQGLLHLVDIGQGRVGAAAAPSAGRELLARFRELARGVGELAQTLGVALAHAAGELPPAEITDFAAEYDDLRAQFESMRARTDEVRRQLTDASDRALKAVSGAEHARLLTAANVELARLPALRFTSVRIGCATPATFAAVAESLQPHPFAIIPLAPASSRTVAAVVAAGSAREQLDAVLRRVDFECLDAAAAAPDAERPPSPDEATAAEASARSALAALRTAMETEIQAVAARTSLAILLLQALTCFASAGRFLVISGWIPEAHAPELTAALARLTDGRAVTTIDYPATAAASAAALSPPVLYRNPLLLRPFQRLVELYGTPSYAEIQPTAFFAISFLIMFGLMFGDVGHGLVLMAAGYCLFRYMPRYLDYGVLLMEAGAASSGFGLLYGSVFGVERWIPTLWLHPIRDLARFTTIAAALGITMISAGFAIGAINAWRSGDRASALVGVHGLLGAFAYWTCLAVVARAILPRQWIVPDAAIAVLLAGAAALLLLRPVLVSRLAPANGRAREEGRPWWLAALEASVELVDAIVGYFTNTISFVRVAAFGAVHAAVLIAVFAMADTLARFRFGGALSVAALVAGNVLIILLEGLTVTVQALRLEYYEFFGRFFRGGGEPYRPLMLGPRVEETGHG